MNVEFMLSSKEEIVLFSNCVAVVLHSGIVKCAQAPNKLSSPTSSTVFSSRPHVKKTMWNSLLSTAVTNYIRSPCIAQDFCKLWARNLVDFSVAWYYYFNNWPNWLFRFKKCGKLPNLIWQHWFMWAVWPGKAVVLKNFRPSACPFMILKSEIMH